MAEPENLTRSLCEPLPTDTSRGLHVGGRCLGRVELRKDWDKITRPDLLGGRVTNEEALWMVIFTMGIASNRDRILQAHDLERWVLDFFMVWGPVAATVQYSARFNAPDGFHHLLWSLFLCGMAGQIACLNHNLSGAAAFTAALYGLIVLAMVRAAWLLPRARPFGLYFAASYAGAVLNAASIALLGKAAGVHVRGLLWLNALWEAGATVFFLLATEHRPARRRTWDVPVSIEYVIRRYEGFHMTITVCSFLFPLALQAQAFATSAGARVAILLANVYALALKLALLDSDHVPVERHAIRRSRPTAITYLVVHPLSMLGIGITGVGFIALVSDAQAPSPALHDISSTALCLGPAITWSAVGVTKLLHTPLSDVQAHTHKAAVLCGSALVFLAPRAFRLSDRRTQATAWFVTATMVLTFALQLLVEYANGSRMDGWRLRAPRLLIDWADHAAGARVGARISGMEHFFTVLVAVAVFALNRSLQEQGDVLLYTLKLLVLYGMLVHTMRYASRFADEDGAHKILWSAFQFGLLLLLLGLTYHADAPWSLHKCAAVAMYLFVALGFSGRVVAFLPRGRPSAAFFAGASLAAAALLATTLPASGYGEVQMAAAAAMVLLAEPLLGLVLHMFAPSDEVRRRIGLPVNAEYLAQRFQVLQLEVMTVAVIVPNAVYPLNAAHAACVAGAVLLACFLALALKAAIFDVAPVSLDHHAVAISERSRHLFFLAQPPILLGIALTGGAMSLLIPVVDRLGPRGSDRFAQGLMARAAAVTLGALSVEKLTHRWFKASVHLAKAAFGVLGALVLAAWPALAAESGALQTIAVVVGTTCLVVVFQLALSAAFPAQESLVAG
uniref:Uncharacterized protein n=1 Tax=Alexandrium monilatum TaxID=311494 RepID=A0A7S4T1A0_9DINO